MDAQEQQQLLMDQAQAMQDLQRLVTSLEVRLQESEMKADEAKQDQLAQPATTKKVDDFVTRRLLSIGWRMTRKLQERLVHSFDEKN